MHRFVFLATVLAVSLSYADDASFVGDGATVYTTQESRIVMRRETIRISYDEQAKDRRKWRADCRFEFENQTDQTVTLTMGFPDWYPFGEGTGGQTAVAEFTTEIDGKKAPVEEKKIAKDRFGAPWKVPGRVATFDSAIVWPVTFRPHAKMTVTNTFKFGGFTSNGPFDILKDMPATYPKIRKQDMFWSVRKPKSTDIDFGNGLAAAVGYIVTTGLTWSGAIGEADITFDLPPMLRENPHFVIAMPNGYKLERDRISWHFRNFRPKEEIALYYISGLFFPDGGERPFGFEYKEQAEAWVRFASKSKVAPEVVDRLIAITPKRKVQAVLEKFKSRMRAE